MDSARSTPSQMIPDSRGPTRAGAPPGAAASCSPEAVVADDIPLQPPCPRPCSLPGQRAPMTIHIEADSVHLEPPQQLGGGRALPPTMLLSPPRSLPAGSIPSPTPPPSGGPGVPMPPVCPLLQQFLTAPLAAPVLTEVSAG